MNIKKAANILKKDSYNVWVRRLNWRFMDERIEAEFNKCKLDFHNARVLGSLYIHSKKNDTIFINETRQVLKPYQSLLSTEYINSTNVCLGRRELGIQIYDKDKKSLISAYEKNAQLWYAQGPSGDVVVFISPYESNLGKINENNIIIGRYQNPYQVNEFVIKKHFSIFFKYCTCTSLLSSFKLKCYLYRQYLIFKDLRFRFTYWQKFTRFVERILIIILTAGAIWASLYVGGKI